jgi:hypothetical protein
VVAVAALVGGVALIRDPSGAPIGLATSDLHGFESYATPGILLVILAWVQLGAAFLVAKPGAHGLVASQLGGALLALFTAFGAALVTPLHGWQLATLLTGAVIFIVAHELHSDEPHTPLLP